MSIKPRSTNPNHRDKIDRINSQRLTQLSEFLKSCRQRTNPEIFGLPERPRRRNPGLSRAEVANLAGMSIDWYTWLEQGRSIRPSTDVLNQLAKVFQLTEPERRHLYSLADYTPIPTEVLDADIRLMQRMISHLPKAPALFSGKIGKYSRRMTLPINSLTLGLTLKRRRETYFIYFLQSQFLRNI